MNTEHSNNWLKNILVQHSHFLTGVFSHYISNNFHASKLNEPLMKTHTIYENVNSFSKKGFTPLWYSIRHCRWVWVIRTTEMHQSSGNGRGPTQYFIIFRPPWLRILHEECPVYLSSQILTEHQRNPKVPWYPPGIVDWQRARIPLRSHVIWQFVTWLPIGGFDILGPYPL